MYTACDAISFSCARLRLRICASCDARRDESCSSSSDLIVCSDFGSGNVASELFEAADDVDVTVLQLRDADLRVEAVEQVGVVSFAVDTGDGLISSLV